MEQAIEDLVDFIEMYRGAGPLPILWVGAGASAAAGHPTLGQVEEALRKRVKGSADAGFALLDAFVGKWGKGALANELQSLLGKSRPFVGLHASMARLAGAGVFEALFTTNYDELLEDALKAQAVDYVPVTLELNYRLQGRKDLLVLKLHGGRTDWASVILSGQSYASFASSYPLLNNQLDLNLRTHPLLFVGCSMRDPRVLDWLRAMPESDRGEQLPGRVLLTRKEWGRLSEEERGLLGSANIKPVLVESHAEVASVLAVLATRFAPLGAEELVFDLTPGPETWTVVGPTRESAPHTVGNPFVDVDFIEKLAMLRKEASRPVILGRPEAAIQEAAVGGLARTIGARLTDLLFSAEARAQVSKRIHAVDRGRARLTLRVAGTGEQSDRALALPWELLMPEAGEFAVRKNKLDVVREAVTEGAPVLTEATEALTLAVSIAAPEDQSSLRYEDEAFRLYRSLVPLGHRVAFADLGDVEDLVRAASAAKPTAIHFSGHGMPGRLVFEDELGLAKEIKVDDLVRRLHRELTRAGESDRFPRFFFLASCYGASGDTSPVSGSRTEDCRDEAAERCDEAIGRGPSTAAALHRNGFVQVLGYFGPISDALCTRAEETFYGAVAEGRTTLQAVAEARDGMSEDLDFGDGQKARFPYAWTQLALYHRGPDLPLARPGNLHAAPEIGRFQRKTVEVSGLPLLKFGFIGRRALQHLIRRKVEKDEQRLIVLQGLGGLGKTALASHLIQRVFAPDPADALILTCKGLDPTSGDPANALWQQAEEHGQLHGVAGWEATTKALREKNPAPDVGFEQTVRLLRKARPKLVVYADNMETLQEGPASADAKALGSWMAAGLPCWKALERLSEEGRLVMASTRYRWDGLEPDALVAIEPMRGADVLRMIETFKHLGKLPREVQAKLSWRVDGHPRTVEYLDTLVGEQRAKPGVSLEGKDAWEALVAPVLPVGVERITADLLLGALWGRLSEEARGHAKVLSVLRRPAPKMVVDALGRKETAEELIGAGVLTKFREQSVGEEDKLAWLDRWGMHSVVGGFVSERVEEAGAKNAHRAAGIAYEEWTERPGARALDRAEGIAHLHEAGEGDRAWPMTERHVVWLRDKALYREAIETLERCEAAGTRKERLSNVLMHLGQIKVLTEDRSDKIEAIFDRALSLTELDETRGLILGEKGRLFKYQGKYEKAETLLRQSLDLKKKAPGLAHPDYGATLYGLAEVLEAQGKYKEAEQLFQQSLSILDETLGVTHPIRGALLEALAGLLHTQGKYEEAETMIRQSLVIKGKTLGVTHPEYGASLHNLAGALLVQGKSEQAEALFRQSLAIREEAFSTTHPIRTSTINGLAETLRVLGKYEEAEELLRQLLSAFEEQHLGATHPQHSISLNALSGVLHAQGKYVEAEAALRKALAFDEEILGFEHPSLNPVLTNLGVMLAEQGRAAEGEPFIHRALDIARSVHGLQHPATAQTLNILAQLQAGMGKSEAPDTAKEALDALIQSLGIGHPLTQQLAPVLRRIVASNPAITQNEDDEPTLDIQLNQGLEALKSNDPLHAVRLLSPVAEQAREANIHELEAIACGLLSQAFFLTGDKDATLTHARRALEVAQHLDNPKIAQNFRRRLTLLESNQDPSGSALSADFDASVEAALQQAQQDDLPGALQALQALAEEAQHAGAPGPEASARIFLGQLYLAAAKRDLAAIELRRALAIAEQIGDANAAAHIRGLLAG